MARGVKILLALAVLGAFGGGIFLALRHQPAAVSPSTPQPAAPASAAPQAANPAPPADCLLPGPAPVPPDGRVATAQDMSLGHDVAQAFVEQLEAYQACRNDQADHAPAGTTDAQKDKFIEQGNAAVDEANAIKDAYAEQMQIFKARMAGGAK